MFVPMAAMVENSKEVSTKTYPREFDCQRWCEYYELSNDHKYQRNKNRDIGKDQSLEHSCRGAVERKYFNKY
ncbi:hypothetical protein TorRG33x02_010590 [Trema orientale]|uniref:Uncharacterized protein n=1 Tax=Trema orientale TaxID=63057 RepID=A0A2P5FYY1_TREOI|nr:hypothetical protein TorRG33x02_010590 [Trema orientale]